MVDIKNVTKILKDPKITTPEKIRKMDSFDLVGIHKDVFRFGGDKRFKADEIRELNLTAMAIAWDSTQSPIVRSLALVTLQKSCLILTNIYLEYKNKNSTRSKTDHKLIFNSNSRTEEFLSKVKSTFGDPDNLLSMYLDIVENPYDQQLLVRGSAISEFLDTFHLLRIMNYTITDDLRERFNKIANTFIIERDRPMLHSKMQSIIDFQPN